MNRQEKIDRINTIIKEIYKDIIGKDIQKENIDFQDILTCICGLKYNPSVCSAHYSTPSKLKIEPLSVSCYYSTQQLFYDCSLELIEHEDRLIDIIYEYANGQIYSAFERYKKNN